MRKLLFILLCIILFGCTRPVPLSVEGVKHITAVNTLDLTETPVFPLDDKNLTAMNISIKGIAIGNTTQEIMSVFGPPDDVIEKFEKGVTILRYESENKSKIVFNLQDNHVDRMTIFLPFNDELIEENKIHFHKMNITRVYGKPSSVKTYVLFSIFNYDKLGLGLLHRRMTARGMSFYIPKDETNNTVA